VFYNKLLWYDWTSLSYSELTYISTSPAISAYMYRPTIVSPWSRSSGFPLYRPQRAVSVKSSFITALLLLTGDVEHSPGLPRATATPTTDQLIECVNIGVLTVAHRPQGRVAARLDHRPPAGRSVPHRDLVYQRHAG